MAYSMRLGEVGKQIVGGKVVNANLVGTLEILDAGGNVEWSEAIPAHDLTIERLGEIGKIRIALLEDRDARIAALQTEVGKPIPDPIADPKKEAIRDTDIAFRVAFSAKMIAKQVADLADADVSAKYDAWQAALKA